METTTDVSNLGAFEEAMWLHGGADRTRPYYYLAGPMSNIPHNNFPAFDAMAAKLRKGGLNILNPAELDDEQERADAMANVSGEPDMDLYRRCLRRDLDIVLDPNCLGVIVLGPEWVESNGARMETYAACGVGVPLYRVVFMKAGDPVLIEIDRQKALEAYFAGKRADSDIGLAGIA